MIAAELALYYFAAIVHYIHQHDTMPTSWCDVSSQVTICGDSSEVGLYICYWDNAATEPNNFDLMGISLASAQQMNRLYNNICVFQNPIVPSLTNAEFSILEGQFKSGSLYYNSDNESLSMYDGSEWKYVALD
jgi:hypothetical protein